VRTLAGRLVLGITFLFALLPAAGASATTGAGTSALAAGGAADPARTGGAAQPATDGGAADPATATAPDPGLRVRGGRVGARVVFRVGVRNPRPVDGQSAMMFLRSTQPLRWRCRGRGCPAPGATAAAFSVRLEGAGRTLVTAAAGTPGAVALDAVVFAGRTRLAAEHLEAAAAGRVGHGDAGLLAKLALVLAALGAAAAGLWYVLRRRRRDAGEDATWPTEEHRVPMRDPSVREDDGNLWEMAAALRARPPADPESAAELQALLFELRQYAGIDGRIPGRLAALVRERQGSRA
jgi:hypothetical protein